MREYKSASLMERLNRVVNYVRDNLTDDTLSTLDPDDFEQDVILLALERINNNAAYDKNTAMLERRVLSDYIDKLEEDENKKGLYLSEEYFRRTYGLEAFGEEYMQTVVCDMLETLKPREERVLYMYYGIDRQPMSSTEIGKEFRVTGGRINQIRAKAMRKLRHPSRAKKLRDFLFES